MTLQAANRLTAAETQLIDAYTNQIGSLPGDGAVLLKRDGLFDALKRQGLPTRRVETFHYTDLKALLRALPADEPQAVAKTVDPLVSGAHVLNVLQGVAQRPSALPDGLSIALYRDALSTGAAADGLTAFNADDTIGRLNGA
ncbi:MAG: Fe-S cluster assembly protein SufD, partial [Agrobacterium albertimagni]